ncbi:MAG: 50S ribosomal protein L7 [Clostridiales bacterium GWB2_37_7]|nr:MAG: 50S ribosomal protein L7 [Clostridiales bacterium GWB2_37_7]
MLNLRTSNLIIGLKQTLKAIQSDKASTIYLASDADDFIRKSVQDACAQKNLEIVYVITMKELGEACGIDIGASTAAVILNNPAQ